MTARGPGYRERVQGRIRRARRRGLQAMLLVAVLSLALLAFLLHGLITAVRLGDGSALRAGWIGLLVMALVIAVSWLLYRSPGRVLEQAERELDEILGEEVAGGPEGGRPV